MSATSFTYDELLATQRVSQEIGAAVRRGRIVRDETQLEYATRIGAHVTTLSRFERGEEQNLKLGTLLRLCSGLGLELGIAPSMPTERSERIANLVDRILALPGGEDLLRYHLKQRGLELARRREP